MADVGFIYIKSETGAVYVLNQLTGTKRHVISEESSILKKLGNTDYAARTIVDQKWIDALPEEK